MTEPITRAALITGGGTGIGAHTARRLAQQGIAVAVCGRRRALVQEIAEEIATAGGASLALACDVADPDQAHDAVARTVEEFGRLDILINNAGLLEPEALIAEAAPGTWKQNVEVNLVGPFNMTQAALPYLQASDDGALINISTGAAFHALPGWSAYCASKAGLAMFTQCLHAEHGPDIAGDRAVRIYGFSPGTVWTAMQLVIRKRKINPVGDLAPMDLHSPARPAHVIAWLASAEAADLAGQELAVSDDELRARAGVPAELEISPEGIEDETPH